ncbi:MAG: hypothetical protein K6F32_02605 [Bacilli bacterium]|nr:hypothetical protein [Bacilli bacterium]
MKRKSVLFTIMLCISACVIGGISSAVAWFSEKASVGEQTSLVGESQGAYFARGTGTATEPFIINRPVHLYNLAWLQYIGYFNDSNAPYYFALDPVDASTDLDMSGWVLPPIGTTMYPFIGHFTGNNELISNLTVDNVIDAGHITRTPTFIKSGSVDSSKVLKVYEKGTESITSGTFLSSTVDIVGFFGVVGEYTGMAEVDAAYSDVNSINALALDGATVSSSSSKTLVGIVCGYDNATLSGVAVDNATINAAEGASCFDADITENISDYSLVGAATDAALEKCYLTSGQAALPQIENPNTTNGGTEWGGSIDIKSVYEKLKTIRDSDECVPLSYNTEETYKDGVLQSSTSVPISDSVINGSYYYIREEGRQLTSDGKVYASFNFKRRSTSSTFASYNDDESNANNTHVYANFTGERSFEYTKKVTNQYTSIPTDASFQISDGGSNYLKANSSGTVSNATSQTAASIWTLGSDGYLTTTIGSTAYYLYFNGTSLSVSTSDRSAWSKTGLRLYTAYGNKNYYLTCHDSSWSAQLTTATVSTTTYVISSGNYYLTNSGTSLSRTSTQSSGTRWIYNSAAKNFSTEISGTTYYLCATRNDTSSDSGTLALTTSYDGSLSFNLYPSSTLSSSSATNTRIQTDSFNYEGWFWTETATFYLRYANRAFSISTSSSTLTVTPYATQTSYDFDLGFGAYEETATTYKTYPTYFPLLMHPTTFEPMDGYQADENSVKQYNTGYIASGANIDSGNEYQDLHGDIRFAGYPYDASGNSGNDSLYNYTNNKKIYTRTNYLNGSSIGSSGWVTIDGSSSTLNGVETYKLQKLKKSYENLCTTLSDSSDEGFVFGVHFMDCAISIDRLVTVGMAKVLDQPATWNDETKQYEDHISTYYDYQVPQDCIDFNLKNYGYVNFFAGTYYVSGTTNNSFFSLNEIVRKSGDEKNQIKEINTISKIYAPDYKDASGNYLSADDDHPYIYEYKDANGNTWFADGVEEPDSDQLLFDCSWIEDPNNSGTTLSKYSMYYFEIPVNKGEYALGSVSGRSGAYLIYLDIGAGAANFKDVNITEQIDFTFINVSFPKGVDFADLTSSNFDAKAAAATGGNSACVTIVGSTSALEIEYAYTTNDDAGTSALQMSSSGNDPPAQTDFTLAFKQDNVTATYLSAYQFSASDVEYTIGLTRSITENFNPSVGTGSENVTYVELYTISAREAGATVQLPNLGVNNSVTWTVTSGTGTVSSTGLVTFGAQAEIQVEARWVVTTEVGDDWEPFDSNNQNGAEDDPIIEFHYFDYTTSNATVPNIVVSFVYSESGKGTNNQTYYYDITVSNTCGVSIYFIVDSFMNTYASETDSTYVLRITYGDTTVTVTANSKSFTIPAAS